MTRPLSRSRIKLALVILSTLAPAIAPTAAMSADMDPIYVDEQVVTPVEFGSGWYLRGDVGYSFHGPFDEDGTDADDLDFTPINASVAVGYQYNDYLRGELEFGYLGSMSFDSDAARCSGISTFTPIAGPVVVGPDTIGCEGHVVGENEMWNSLVNGYVDLGQYGGFKPYVGAGLGLVYNNYSGDSDQPTCTDTSVTDATGTTDFVCDVQPDANSESGKSYGFLWQLSAGFGYQLTENTMLDVGYRYLSSPNVLQVVNKSGVVDTKEGMSAQQVRIGLRYAIW
jgi:opacity protein-like surface antigen